MHPRAPDCIGGVARDEMDPFGGPSGLISGRRAMLE